MIYYNIQDIPYSFLKDAVLSVSKKYNIKKVRMNPYGEVFVKVQGKLDGKDIKFIMDELVKGKDIQPDYNNDWEYADDDKYTYIYSPDGVDYTKL